MQAFKSCMNCVAPKRHPGCHGTCPEYLEARAEYDRLKSAYDREQAISASIYSSRTEKVEKALRYKRHKKN